MGRTGFLIILIAFLLEEGCLGWSKFPCFMRGQTTIFSSTPLGVSCNGEAPGGGQHLVRAGQSLQAAADYVNTQKYACPHLLRDAGISLIELGEAWLENNWEAVTYAAQDCSSSLFALSQLQRLPDLQRVYKGASGELMVISSIHSTMRGTATLNLQALSVYFMEAANVVEQLNEGQDSVPFSQSLREAAMSIESLVKES